MKRSFFCILTAFFALFGGCAKSPTSPNSSGWVKATDHAFSSGRYGLSGAVFNGAMWAIGGASSDASGSVTTYYPEVWSSGSGSSWSEATASAPFGGRYGSQVLSFNGKMWLIGGNQSGNFKNDVWNTTDGVNWTQVLPNAPPSATQFSAREDFGAVVFNNAIWVFSGWAGGTLGDAWSSPDGITWTQMSPGWCPATSAAGSGRWGFVITTYNNLIWIMGGATGGATPTSAFSDVWNSPNGINWAQASNGNPFGNLIYSQVVVNNNQIWLTGGTDIMWGPRNYVFNGTNGINWAPTFPKFQERFYHLSLSFNNQVWVIGGMDNFKSRTYFNDVWHSP